MKGKIIAVNPFEVPIVMYHTINDRPFANPLGCLSFYTDEFIAHLKYFHNEGFEFATISDLVHKALDGKVGKSKLVALTFDDGFLDNYLIAADILNDFRAKGTVFVNPGHTPSGPARSLKEIPEAWGNLNFEEMRLMEKSGIFEIQSHTLSHEDIFVSDKLIDFYTPDKIHLYYWLIWKLIPQTRTALHSDITRYSGLIPAGYPIFEYGRPLRGKQFFPSEEFISLCVQQFKASGDRCMANLQAYSQKGVFETDDAYAQRVDDQVFQSKKILERELNKEIECICFPGDVYSTPLLSRAQAAGHRVFMRHPRETTAGNLAALQKADRTLSANQMIGLQRFVFNYDYRKIFPRQLAAYWTARFTVEGIQGNVLYTKSFSTARWLKRSVFKLGQKSREQRCEQ